MAYLVKVDKCGDIPFFCQAIGLRNDDPIKGPKIMPQIHFAKFP
jgi:hypothetical protein